MFYFYFYFYILFYNIILYFTRVYSIFFIFLFVFVFTFRVHICMDWRVPLYLYEWNDWISTVNWNTAFIPTWPSFIPASILLLWRYCTVLIRPILSLPGMRVRGVTTITVSALQAEVAYVPVSTYQYIINSSLSHKSHRLLHHPVFHSWKLQVLPAEWPTSYCLLEYIHQPPQPR